MSETSLGVGRGADSWRQLRWWDISVVGVVAIVASPSSLGSVEWRDAGWDLSFVLSIGVLAGVLALYVVLGRPALRRGLCDAPLRTTDYAFVLVFALLVGCACALSPSFAIFQVLAYPMAWTILPRYRDGVLASAGIAVLVCVGSAIAYTREGVNLAIETAALTALLSFGFSVAMGTWISRIFEQGEKYRKLAEELRSAQAEVRELSLDAGAAAERERLSRELHDTLTQTLTGLVMLSEQASRALDEVDVDRARDRMERVTSAARIAVSEARALVATTQPLGDGGLEAALTRVADRLRDDAGLQVHLQLEVPRLEREQEVVLLRAAQEGLANARKHARASSVTVRLGEEEGAAVLEVEDDGVGIPLDRQSSGGYGLRGLSDRVRIAGGEARVAPVPSGGTLLSVRLPLSGVRASGSELA